MNSVVHKMKIGFIGQGWIGRNYADNFEARGYEVVRYALEAPYNENKALIAECGLVFIAVPTPTTPLGFDDSTVRDALMNLSDGSVAIVKSTLAPGTTNTLANDFSQLRVVHSPEFLVEKTAAHDAAHPQRNIIGIPEQTAEYQQIAQVVLSVLPKAPYEAIMPAIEAELVKYAGNCFLYTKVVFMNMLYDLVVAHGGDWETVRAAMIADGRIGVSHTSPLHQSGRGAGGHCFVKDFEVFRRRYQESYPADTAGAALLAALVQKNLTLLHDSEKDQDIVEGVYGHSAPVLQ